MQIKHIATVFRKDALELLRDKRTWFVNIVLPVLLYPVLAMIGIQVFQITQPGPEDIPSLGVYDAPMELRTLLEHKKAVTDDDDSTEKPKEPEHQLKLKSLSHGDAATFIRYLNAAKDSEDATLKAEKEKSLAALRDLEVSAVLICERDADKKLQNWKLQLIADNAHADYLKLSGMIKTATSTYRKSLLDQRLKDSGLATSFIKPAQLETNNLASLGESVRTHFLAGFLPVLLVLMVIVGTFHPAPDLIAGERERGTLETLLAWPSDRQSIFIGKLLVVIAATIATVLLNLTSLTVTANILGAQLPSGGNSKIQALSDLVSVGPSTIFYCIIALLPITILIATLSLAVAGLAKSYKEAQNYLSPMVILFTMPSLVCLLPNIKPHFILDLIPLIGPLVALKACLQNADLAIIHLLVATIASVGISAMVVSWATTLLNKEQFLFPNIKNFGLKQLKHLSNKYNEHGGLESMFMFTVCLGLMIALQSSLIGNEIALTVSLPLILGIGAPCIIFVFLKKYSFNKALYFNKLPPINFLWTILLIPVALMISMSLGVLQTTILPPAPDLENQMTDVLKGIYDFGGLYLLLFIIAIVPGVSEELLCRGILLSGFNKSLGQRYAILMSAFLFAAMHGSPHKFFPQFFLGLFLAFIVIRTRSIWPAMIIHAGHNGIIGYIAYLGFVDPEVGRSLQEQSKEAESGALLYPMLGVFVVMTLIAYGLCILMKPNQIEASQDPEKA